MRATMYGCEIVWSAPIGNAASSYARTRHSGGTNRSRGTVAIASSTRPSSMPRARSCHSTIDRRSDNERTEVREHCGGDVGDALDRRLDSDGEHGHDGVALDKRAVAAAAGVVAAAEIGELPARGGRDEQLAGVRVREREPGSPQRVGMVEEHDVAARLPAVGARPEAKLLAFAPRDRFAALETECRLDGRHAVERDGEHPGVDPGV